MRLWLVTDENGEGALIFSEEKPSKNVNGDFEIDGEDQFFNVDPRLFGALAPPPGEYIRVKLVAWKEDE